MFKPVFIVDDRVSFGFLSLNPNAIHLLEQNLDEVDWYYLSGNPNAIHILEKNLDKVNWYSLSENPNAIHILEQNLDRVDWDGLSTNPNAIHLLCKLNTEQMRLNCRSFAEELSKYVFHPVRLSRLSQCYNIDLTEYFELM